VGFKRAAESTDCVASSSKQARTGQALITQHIVSQHAMQQAAWNLAQFFFTSNIAWRLVVHKNLVAAFEPSERNWSLFGNIISKTKNRLALERAKKLSHDRSNSDSGGTGADEEVALSLADVVIEDEEEAEE